MSNIDMTLSSDQLTLEGGKGAVTASVTNSTDRAERVVVRAFGGRRVAAPQGSGDAPTAPDEGTPAPGTGDRATAAGDRTTAAGDPGPTTPEVDPARWATVEESLRTLAPRTTEQYTVSFDAGTSPGGTYAVRLNAYSADEPPEANSGPVLDLELVVPARAVKKPEPKRRWWIIVAAVVLVAVVAVVTYLLWPSRTAVPDLEGLLLADAQQAVADAGLVGQFDPVESSEPPDTVLSQDPPAGTEVEPESLVTVGFAAEQTVVVPELRAAPAGAARSGLADSGLGVVLHEDSTCTFNSPSFCVVIDQLPPAGQRVPLGSDVMLQLSGAVVDPFPWPIDICDIVFCEFRLPDGTERLELPDDIAERLTEVG